MVEDEPAGVDDHAPVLADDNSVVPKTVDVVALVDELGGVHVARDGRRQVANSIMDQDEEERFHLVRDRYCLRAVNEKPHGCELPRSLKVRVRK